MQKWNRIKFFVYLREFNFPSFLYWDFPAYQAISSSWQEDFFRMLNQPMHATVSCICAVSTVQDAICIFDVIWQKELLGEPAARSSERYWKSARPPQKSKATTAVHFCQVQDAKGTPTHAVPTKSENKYYGRRPDACCVWSWKFCNFQSPTIRNQRNSWILIEWL